MVDFTGDASFKDRFDLGAKDQSLSISVVIQRLLAKPITCCQETVAISVPNGEGEHAAQVLDTLITVLLIGVNDSLSITTCGKVMTMTLQFFPQLPVVIDFAIEDNHDALIFIKNGLMAASQVNNREATYA